MTNNSIFTRVLALMICLVMLVGTLTACFNEVDPENNVGTTTNGGVVTTNPTTKPTTTTTTTPTTGDVVEDDPIEDPVEPVDPNEIFSASTDILSDGLIYGTLASDVVIGGAEMGALVPADVKVEAGASNLALSVKKVDEEALGDALSALDVHINGVALDNTVPMIVKLGAILEAGLGATELKLYHTENGVDNLMTRVNSPSDFAIHNQYYYNAETGEVTIYVASFSVFTAVKSTADVWTGESDTTWYVGNENAEEYTLNSAEQLAGFRDLVDSGVTFAGKVVKLGADIDLKLYKDVVVENEDGSTTTTQELVSFDPIGKGYVHNGGQAFMGTFDGQGHTIYNLYQNGWDLNYSYSTVGGGLFASIKDATIRNLAISGANIVMECIDMGTVVGYAQGKCTFENIVVTDSKLANYQRYTGGVVGEVCKGDGIEDTYTHTFTNVTVDSSVKISSLWGDFDNACGGVIGGKWGTARVLMQNVTVACEIDAFSDVTAAYQWYAYRRCGMLIGHTEQNSPKSALNAAAEFLTCENVNVYYGDWVNYTYYQFANQTDEAGTRLWNSNYPWVRAEAGEYNGAFSNVRYGNPIIGGQKINTLELAEANYTGKVTITFNQLYGGGQGVYGAADHNYNGGGVKTHKGLTKTVYINNNLGWENLKLHYWFMNGEDTWTTVVDGIDMSTMLAEGNVYKLEIPAYAYGFVILADGENVSDTFVLAELEENKTVDLGALACTHENTTTTTVDATCTTDGSTTVTCDDCKEVLSVETISATGHNYDAVVTNPTCTEAGYTTYTCACGDTYKEDGDAALGHNWGTTSPYACTHNCGNNAPTKTIYFQNNWLWTDVKVYYWYEDNSWDTKHPGIDMEIYRDDTFRDIYYIEIPAHAYKFQINGINHDNATLRQETVDLLVSEINDEKVYSLNAESNGKVSVKVSDLATANKIYFNANAWTTTNSRFVAYFFKIENSSATGKWVNMTIANGSTYECEIPKGYSGVVFVRKNSSNTTNDWNNVLNQTPDVTLYELYITSSRTYTAETGKLYLKPNDNWKTDNARFAAYFFGNGEKWVSMEYDKLIDAYKCDKLSGYTKVIFCRMNPSTTTNNWNNKWNQTGDLTIPTDGNNFFALNSGSWDVGTWSKKQ